MHVRHFKSQLWLPRPRPEVFAFFSDPKNLDLITPPWLHFRTISQSHDHMQQDTVMDHRLRIHGFPLLWRSQITDWDPPARFVDEQIHGPYQLWVHEHQFEERGAGTLVRDHVRYAVRLDFLIHRFLIQPDIKRIFSYRSDRLRRLFAVAA